jgi:thymidylate kinase
VVAGPDGAGKSTFCDELIAGLPGSPKVLRIHHRPGVLPVRGGASGSTDPRASDPYPGPLSLLKTMFLFVDYRLGWAARIRPAVKRGEWVLIERGWWDLVVDPERYRLHGGGLARALGRLLPKPDITVVLEAPGKVMNERKNELPEVELDRQAKAWRTGLPSDARRTYVDATRPPQEMARSVLARLEGAPQRAGREWVNLPTKRDPRWYIPIASSAGFTIHQPMTPKALVGWKVIEGATRLGLGRFLRGESPPAEVIEAVSNEVPDAASFAVARAHDRTRYVCLAIDERGEPVALAKFDPGGGPELGREASALQRLGDHLPGPLRTPVLVRTRPSLLVFAPERWRMRLRPWRLPEEVAEALGRFYASSDDGPDRGRSHGDFAPWNLLETDRGWVLIDWEDATDDGPPFFDLWHYLVQAHVLLGRPSGRDIERGLTGAGWVGRAVTAYARGAGLPRDRARELLVHYLTVSRDNLDPGVRHAEKATEARRALLDRLKDG